MSNGNSISSGVRGNCLLYQLRILMFADQKADSTLRDSVTAQHSAESGTVSVYKSFFHGEDTLKEIRKIYNQARNHLQKHTLPWGDQNIRIIKKDKWPEFEAAMVDFHSKFDVAVDAFLADYDNMKDRSKVRLGNLWSEDTFPTKDELKESFVWIENGAQIPDIEDFRVEMSAEDAERFKNLCANTVKRDIENTVVSNLGKIRSSVGRFFDRMGSYGVDPATKKVVGKFKDDTVHMLSELADFVESYNITDNDEIREIAKDIRELGKLDPDDLRNNPQSREKAHSKAEQILKRVSNMEDNIGA